MKALLPLLAALALASGCATNVNTVSRAQDQATPSYVADKRVITDASLAGMIRILSVNESTVSGNLKKIQVTLENAKNNSRVVNYRFEWTDQDGMAASSTLETWKSLSLAGRETVTVSSVATSPKSVDFKLKLLEPGR
jgi:uncharacterized protein YcfL